jgi:hypothetical protein
MWRMWHVARPQGTSARRKARWAGCGPGVRRPNLAALAGVIAGRAGTQQPRREALLSQPCCMESPAAVANWRKSLRLVATRCDMKRVASGGKPVLSP